MTDDTLTLTVKGQRLTGWQRVSVTRSLESVPASFDIQVTEKYPDTAQVDARAGDPCTVQIGSDLVLTGYVDRYVATISGADHTIRISGRSKSEDLVDCAAMVEVSDMPGGQIMGGTALTIAQTLAGHYNVGVRSLVDDLEQVPQFNVDLGETCWEVIQRVNRFSKVVAYDMPDGTVVLARAGSETMASGFALGVNMESAEVTFSMDQRFSIYEAHFLSSMVMGNEWGPGGAPIITDPGVPRFRKRYVISEQSQLGQSLAKDRAEWERNNRMGHGAILAFSTDSWRDKDGKLYAPNHKAPIKADLLKLVTDDWIIATVSYRRDENGQHADITMMDPIAFTSEPIALQPLPPLAPGVANNPADTSTPTNSQWVTVPPQ